MTPLTRRAAVRDDAHEIRAVGCLWAELQEKGRLDPEITAPDFLDSWHRAVEATAESEDA